jgi:hypothetical protein
MGKMDSPGFTFTGPKGKQSIVNGRWILDFERLHPIGEQKLISSLDRFKPLRRRPPTQGQPREEDHAEKRLNRVLDSHRGTALKTVALAIGLSSNPLMPLAYISSGRMDLMKECNQSRLDLC